MFVKSIKLKKLLYIILVLLINFSYFSWLFFRNEKKNDFFFQSLQNKDDILYKIASEPFEKVTFSFDPGSLALLDNFDPHNYHYLNYDMNLLKEKLQKLNAKPNEFYNEFIFSDNYLINNYSNLFLLEKEIEYNNTKSILPFIIHYILSSLFLIIGLLIAVAFFTLLERKVMASMQRRKGPNVVGFWGLLQPLADGLKLLAKEIIVPRRANIRIFLGSPLYTFLMSLLGWCVIPWSDEIIFADPKLSALYVMATSSLGVYGVMLAGWASNSKYAFLGGLRSAAQMISYEVSLGFILVIVALFSGTYNLKEIVYKQETIWYCFPLFPLVLIFFVSMLAETNRAPFDLPEAEAELVSGYNTEYSSMVFAMFFLGEYSSMLLMAALMVIFFFGGWLPPCELPFEMFEGFWFFIKIVVIAFAYVWVRATLPRYRYNQLMSIGWKIFLPITFGLLIFYIGLLLFFDGLPVNSDYNTFLIESGLMLQDKKDLFMEFKNISIDYSNIVNEAPDKPLIEKGNIYFIEVK